jgi:hypothetical protein
MPDYSAYDIRNLAHAKLLTAAPDLLDVCVESGGVGRVLGRLRRPAAALWTASIRGDCQGGGTALYAVRIGANGTEDGEAWVTQCGHLFQICHGSPEDNGMDFCPFCGRPITTEATL